MSSHSVESLSGSSRSNEGRHQLLLFNCPMQVLPTSVLDSRLGMQRCRSRDIIPFASKGSIHGSAQAGKSAARKEDADPGI